MSFPSDAFWTVVTSFFVIVLASIFLAVYRKFKAAQSVLFPVNDFGRGTTMSHEGSGRVALVSRSVSLCYDTSLEIDSTNFVIEWQHTLGSGSLGTVVRAKVCRHDKSMSVAAKTLHENQDEGALRNLLMEIKVSSYLGQHLNITQLVGAYTTEASLGRVYAFFELCRLGSLQNFLRHKTHNDSLQSTTSYVNLIPAEMTKKDLYLKWAGEIANGMEYIGSKFVVHGDLATRNVLLDDKMVAKICDFGLSRRMVNYQNYVKSSSEPLPWRWMAYESLTTMEFSVKSDVWSYGVTIWEIFSDGQLPYPGLSWTSAFVIDIKQGMRLPNPQNSRPDIYDLMMSCWSISSEKRPTFTQLKHKMTEITQQLRLDAFNQAVVVNNTQCAITATASGLRKRLLKSVLRQKQR